MTLLRGREVELYRVLGEQEFLQMRSAAAIPPQPPRARTPGRCGVFALLLLTVGAVVAAAEVVAPVGRAARAGGVSRVGGAARGGWVARVDRAARLGGVARWGLAAEPGRLFRANARRAARRPARRSVSAAERPVRSRRQARRVALATIAPQPGAEMAAPGEAAVSAELTGAGTGQEFSIEAQG